MIAAAIPKKERLQIIHEMMQEPYHNQYSNRNDANMIVGSGGLSYSGEHSSGVNALATNSHLVEGGSSQHTVLVDIMGNIIATPQ
jgi:acid phosphatase family membrane protein YuiD